MAELDLFRQSIQKVVKQHYVPRHYLSAWGRPGKAKGRWLLWCKLQSWAEAKELELMDVGQQKYMYAYPRLGSAEQTLLIQLINSKCELYQGVLKHMYFPALFMPLYLRFLEGDASVSFLNQVKELLEAKFSDDIVYTKMLEVMLQPLPAHFGDIEGMKDDLTIICDNGFESWMTAMELQFNPLIDMALRGDISFFKQKEHRQTFIYYLLIQMLRTTKFDKLVEECKWNKYPDLQKMLRHGTAFEVAVMNAKEWEGYELLLLENHSQLPFITGDQPLVNLDDNEDSPHFDVFYPISPTKAFLFLERNRFESVYSHLRNINEREADELNRKIVKVCSEQLFASSADVFKVGKYDCQR